MATILFPVICFAAGTIAAVTPQSIISFDASQGGTLIAGSGVSPTIYVGSDDWYGVQRAAQDLALDFGRVTGQNGTVQIVNGSSIATSNEHAIYIGTIGKSSLIDSLASTAQLDFNQTANQWEAYQTQLTPQGLVIAGADKRGSIYGTYDISAQIGVSPWYWWADVATESRDAIYATNGTKFQGSASVKFRGFFLNDEQPGLTDWVMANFPDIQNGDAGYAHAFYATVFELLLRLRANYLWPASWGSMFYVDDAQNAQVADAYGVVMGTSHTEPMARATNEQSNPNFMHGVWSWANNRNNVTQFMREGAERASPYETLFTLGMRGLGDVASPTLNASSLEQIVDVQQQILRDVYNTTNVSSIPQMWCLYKEVGSYYAQGLKVPDDVTLLWAEDNWGNAQRLPEANETSRSGGSGLYYHADYVGDPRDYKWINTINLKKQWTELRQAYERGAQTIWVLNVGDLKPLEVPINHFLDMAYDIDSFASANSTTDWIVDWASNAFGSENGQAIADVMSNYSTYAGRRKYELLDSSTYSIINYEEADMVLQQWSQLAQSAQSIHDGLSSNVQPAFFELVLHPVLAGYTVYQIHIGVARNNLYGEQGRTSTNKWSSDIISLFNNDFSITQQYHSLLDGKWKNILSQTHLGYQYWQQPMRNMLPPLAYVQQQSMSLAGPIGVTCEGSNATVPGDDMYHTLSSNVLTLPPMDPWGPLTRWIDVFSRGNVPAAYNVSISDPAVSVSQATGMLSTNGTDTDIRLYLSVDWSQIANATSMVTINITTSTISNPSYINATKHTYGNFGMPQIMLPLNKTAVPNNFTQGGFIESDRHISIEAEHFTSISNASDSGSSSTFLATIPGASRTLSGLTLQPYTAQSQSANSSGTPRLSYDIFTFTNTSNANLTMYFSPALNTYPSRPMKYAVNITPASPAGNGTTSGPLTIQPVPVTQLGTLPEPASTNTTFSWTTMVADAVIKSNSMWNLQAVGAHRIDVWLLEPGLVLQKMVLDLGGVRRSYLGPPESWRWGMS